MIDQPGIKKRHRVLELPRGRAEFWLESRGNSVSMHFKHPNGGGESRWIRCDAPECLGAAITANQKCFKHASSADRDVYISTQVARGQFLLLQGVEITPQVLTSAFKAPVVDGARVVCAISLAGAEIDAEMTWTGLTFERGLDLTGAIVRKPMPFRDCRFKSPVTARSVFFDNGPPSFSRCEFYSSADFSYSHADRVSVGFDECSFAKSFKADGSEMPLLFRLCEFRGDVSIAGAKATHIGMDNCSLAGDLSVSDTACGSFRAQYLTAKSAHLIGPMKAEHDCALKHAVFEARVRIEVEAKRLDLTASQFVYGGEVRVRRAALALNQVSTGQSLHLSGMPGESEEPWVQSLQNADAGSMSFARFDMRRCIFYGSHNLRNVTIEPTVKFDMAPGLYQRRCVADEVAWRSQVSGLHSGKWRALAARIEGREGTGRRVRDTVIQLPELRPSQVAAVYRDLRGCLEKGLSGRSRRDSNRLSKPDWSCDVDPDHPAAA